MTLPKKREKPQSGILRAPPRIYQRHRKWLRSHECVCTLSPHDLGFAGSHCSGATEVSHIRTAANAGTGLKPIDSSAVPMCREHHQQYHLHGHQTFERVYGLDLAKLAAEFASRSPDTAMKEALRAIGPALSAAQKE